jgi:hypothetical protein
MRFPHVRFTIGTMMTAVAVLAILAWLVVGLRRGVAELIGHPPLLLVVAFPLLLSSFATLMVTLVQSRGMPRTEARVTPIEHDELSVDGTRTLEKSAKARKLNLSVLATAVWLGGACASAAAAGFLLASQRPELERPTVGTMIDEESLRGAVEFESATLAPASARVERSPDDDVPVQRASSRLAETKVLPFPPLPTRYSPGPLPEPVRNATLDERAALPLPPVPTKAPPGPVPEEVESNPIPADQTEPSGLH